MIWDEHLDYNTIASVISGSGIRAQGVTPILDYCSTICGFENISKINKEVSRAIRLILGVHTLAPKLDINADLGGISCHTRCMVEKVCVRNYIIAMDNERLTKKSMLWDNNCRHVNQTGAVRVL